MRLSGPGARGPRARLGMSMGPWLRRPGVGQPPGRRTRRHRRDQPAGGARPHARPWRRVRARRGRRRRLGTALRMCDRTRGPAVATGRRSPRSPATCRGPSPPASQGRCLRRRGPQSLPRGAAPPGGDGSRWVPRARGVRRVRETPERTRCVRPGARGARRGDGGRCARGSAPDGEPPRDALRLPDGRSRRRRLRTGDGGRAHARQVPRLDGAPDVTETGTVAKTVWENREGIPGYFGSRPLPTSRRQTRPCSPSRGRPGAFATWGTLPPRSSPGWEGCRSTRSLAIRPSLCHLPETPKSQKFSSPHRHRRRRVSMLPSICWECSHQ